MKPVRVDEAIQAYMEGLLPPRGAVLARIEREAEAEGLPIVGPHEGALLRLLVTLSGGRRILELGAAVGYSGIWLLGGAPEGTLVTYERDPARAARARANFAEVGFGGSATVIEAEAIADLERPGPPFDVCFIDILTNLGSTDAVELALARCVELLDPGGLLLADNTLRQGEVLSPASQAARNALDLNRLVAEDPRLEAVLIPIRDGLTVAVRRG